MAKRFRPISEAPKDGTIIRIRGRREGNKSRYYANAVWTVRKCPARVCDWFPPNDYHDQAGPFLNVEEWRPLEDNEDG